MRGVAFAEIKDAHLTAEPIKELLVQLRIFIEEVILPACQADEKTYDHGRQRCKEPYVFNGFHPNSILFKRSDV